MMVLQCLMRAMSVVWNYVAGMIDKYKTGEQTVENAVKTAVQTIKDDLKVILRDLNNHN